MSAKAGSAMHKMSAVHLESGKSEAVHPAGCTTPINNIAYVELAHVSEGGSVFIDDKRRSARANYSYSTDGISTPDELVMDKAKRHAATRNLDSSTATMHRTPGIPPSAGNLSQISAVKLPMDACVANLNLIGISLGSISNAINVSFNALKRIEVDRDAVQPKNRRVGFEVNSFDASDEEDPENDSVLLSHLVKDLPHVDLDDTDLVTRICDLKVSGRKSKSSSKKR